MRRMPHRHLRYRGHTIAFVQDLEDFGQRLPRDLKSLPILIVRQQGQDDCDHKDFRVRTWLVVRLLEVLPQIHPEVYGPRELFGKSVPAVAPDPEMISRLEDLGCGKRTDFTSTGTSVYRELPIIDVDDTPESANGPAGACGFNDYEMADMGSSGVNGRIDTAGAREIAERAVKQMAKTGGHVTSDTIAETLVQETPIAWPSSKGDPRPVQWPKASKEPVPENTMYYLVGAFPLRFMNTHADLNANRRIKVTMEEYFEGLLYYWDGERYPFACHPTFRYVALNMTFRHHAWNRAVVFANRQLPANISVATIQEQVRTKNDYTINKIFARAGQMKSTAGYWMAERTKWYNLVLYWQHYFKQIPSVFLTVSEPELHDPPLHKLLDQIVGGGKSYYGIEPPPADHKLRRKLAITENLHLVSWFFVQKMRSLHHRVLYPKWKMLQGLDGRVTPSCTRMDEFVDVQTGQPRVEQGPVPAVGGHGGRYEFADRRMMTHLHELLMLPNAPSMEQKLAAITKPNGIDARAIVEWVAENLGLTAVHPTSSKDGWPDPEGTQSKEEKSRAGLAALRQRFGDLSSASERRASEAGILNYCMLHGPCDNYCMRDVKNRAGEVISQRCRMRAELKEEYCCRCTRCMPAEGQWRCEACDDECDGENCKDSACCTSVWMLPGTFRFELRVCRRHARLQVHIESLTHAIRANYDVQFVLDPVAVIEYIVKYKTKPEKRSETFKNLMRQVVLDADAETSLHGLCSQMINLFTGNRDYGDVECCHLLQQLPLMEWSVVFGETFHMDGRRRLDSSGDEGSDAFTASLEEWYINRPAELEQLHSFALLSMFESTGRSYTRITHGPPKVPHYSPFVEMRYSIPPSLAAAANPGAFSSSTKKHEAYCEQRLVMFRPYRKRSDLKAIGGQSYSTFAEAFQACFEQLPPCVKYEASVSAHRQQLAEETVGADVEVPSEDDMPDLEDDDEANRNDPLVALFGQSAPPPQYDPAVHLAPDVDWTSSRFDLSHLNDSSGEGWLVRMKGELGDDALSAGLLDYSKYNVVDLNHHQRFAYELIVRDAEATLLALRDRAPLPAPLRMIVDGYGGTGKSHVLHCAGKYIRGRAAQLGLADPLRVGALSGAAATQVYGGTLHSLYGIPVGTPFDEVPGGEKEKDLQTRHGAAAFLFKDERSMVSLSLFGQIISRARYIWPDYKSELLCRRSVVLFGDDKQLPPPNGGKLYSNPAEAAKAAAQSRAKKKKRTQAFGPTNYQNEAHDAYKQFTTVVQLDVNERSKGDSPEQQLFRRFLLECLRDCVPTKRWYEYWKETNSLETFSPAEQDAFLSGFRVCSTNEAIEKYNNEMLCRVGQPLALIQAEHPMGGKVAASARGKVTGNLKTSVTLCRGAWVVYDVNTWTSRGVVHGLLARVLEIVYAPGTKPHNATGPEEPALPLAVFVEAKGYLGPSYEFLDVPEAERRRLGYAGVFPVQPVKRKFEVTLPRGGKVACERRMIPLSLAWARSIHKFQGMTTGVGQEIPIMLLDIGDTELAAALSYVGASRSNHPRAYCVHPFPTEARFNRIGALTSDGKQDAKQRGELQRREAACQRLAYLARQTIAGNRELYDWCAANCNGGREVGDGLHDGCAPGESSASLDHQAAYCA